jgi:hypothetical protein
MLRVAGYVALVILTLIGIGITASLCSSASVDRTKKWPPGLGEPDHPPGYKR